MSRALLHRLTLRQLEVFRSVCEHGSQSRAADQLNLTQPAVSGQIRQLEEIIGEPLFDHVGRRLFLTTAGTALHRAARDLQARLELLDMELAERRGHIQGRLQLATVSSAQTVMPGLIARYHQLHPAVDVRLTVVNRDQALQRLADNRDDLVIMAQVPQDRALAFVPFQDYRLQLAAHPDHPLAGRPRVALAELAAHTVLVRETGSGSRKALDDVCGARRVRLERTLELGSNEALRQGVLDGLGLALLPEPLIARELDQGELTALALQDFPLRRSWCVVYPRGKHLGPVAEAFLTLTTGYPPGLPHPTAAP